MTSRRRLSVEPADAIRAGVPLLVLVGAVTLPSLAGVFLLVLVGGVAVAVGRRVPVVWAWAAMVPAAVIAALRAFGPAASAWDTSACAMPSSPMVLWAVAEAVLVVAATAALAMVLHAKAGDLAIRRPPRYAVRWAILGAAVILGGGMVGVILVAGPLFGAADVDLGGLGFLMPASVFAVALAVSEELAWRGALQGWLGRTLGPWVAALAQAGVYGIAWGVALGSPLGGVLAAAAGLLLGASGVRTRSLLVPLAWHVAFNVPFYVLIVCAAG
jgi:membrane protease YdiL (CAAX protease family)